MKNYNIRKGDLLIVCELTGMSHSMVKKVSRESALIRALRKLSRKLVVNEQQRIKKCWMYLREHYAIRRQ
jgi:hypothetical protein